MKMFFLITLTTLVATAGLSAAETNGVRSGTPARADYSSFTIVAERNIFNPHRSKHSGDRPPPRTEPEKRVKMDRFALLGTMSYEKGRYAFFDGSSADFRKVAKPEDSIAGFKIAEVAPTCVKLLLTNGTLLELCVGMQMKKTEDSDWQLAGKADSAEGSGTNGSSGSGSAASRSSAPEPDDVLKRLLAKREQEGAPAVTTAAATAPVKIEEPKAAVAAPGEADEVLRKLLQKREQELNK
jgi:hypothetical protein